MSTISLTLLNTLTLKYSDLFISFMMYSFFTFVFFVLLDVEINDPETFYMLDSPQMTSVLVKDLKYFTKQGG